MAKRKTHKTTTIARANASESKDRSARSAKKKKASREAAPILEQVLSVRCPTCTAAPGEQCELSTDLPRNEPHRDRRLNAAD
jgi:hypothetical protein